MMDVVDIWVNVVTSRGAQEFLGQDQFANIPGYLGSSTTEGIGVEGLLAVMDDLGVATGVICAGMDRSAEHALAVADEHPGRFLVALGLAVSDRPTRNVRRVRSLAEHPATAMVRVMPLNNQVAIDDPRHYPVYSVCEELGLPVSINVGIPGPRVRSRVQHPELLEGVLIDFPDLVVIGAHMGHPYEELLMNYMRKWPNLYLSCTAYAPRYMDPALVRFMNSTTYRGRVLWGSDEPWFPMRRSITEARALALDDDAMAQFLGGTARRLLDRTAARGTDQP
jgi:predicted TIM-barrel fold metal-dependent hydrolase